VVGTWSGCLPREIRCDPRIFVRVQDPNIIESFAVVYKTSKDVDRFVDDGGTVSPAAFGFRIS